MVHRLALLFAVVALALTGIAGRMADAKDTNGCDGLGDYRAAMFRAGREYLDVMEQGVPNWQARDVTTYSSDEWRAIADASLEMQRAVKAVTPPAWAKPWHDLQVERWGLAEQMSRAIAVGGIFAAIPFGDRLDQTDARLEAAINEIAETCADFPAFDRDWDALDGINREGTPVATPVD